MPSKSRGAAASGCYLREIRESLKRGHSGIEQEGPRRGPAINRARLFRTLDVHLCPHSIIAVQIRPPDKLFRPTPFMSIIDYASTLPSKIKRPRGVILLMMADVAVFIVAAACAFILGDDPKPPSPAVVILVIICELTVPITVFLFIFLLGWLASDHWRSRKDARP